MCKDSYEKEIGRFGLMISYAKKKKDSNMPERCFADGILVENDAIDRRTISHA